MNKRNLENLIAGVGLIGILFLFGIFVAGFKTALILLAVFAVLGCFVMLAFKGNCRRRMIAFAMVIPVIAVAIAVNAADPKSGSGNIIANALTFSWTGKLEQVHGDYLSETGWDATFNQSSTVDETDSITGEVKKGTITLTLTATTSKYEEKTEPVDDGCGGTKDELHYYRPGQTTLAATITNVDTQRPMRIKTVSVVKEENCSSTSLGIAAGDLLRANGDSFEVKVVAHAGESSASVTATYEVTIEYEYVGYVSLFADAQDNVDYTITTTDSEKSSITVAAGSALAEHEFAVGTEITPSITVPSGYKLHGWRLSNGKLLDNGEKFVLDNDVTVYPILLATDQEGQVIEKSVFQVGTTATDSNQFWFWEDAVTYAMSDTVTDKTIVLLRDYTLRSDPHLEGTTAKGSTYTKASENGLSYVIPSGVTLLIPFDDANTLYTTEPGYTDTDSTYVTPSAYRTLTMASGTKITVNGAISVSGKHRVVQGAAAKNIWGGAPTGKVGFIKTENNSSIEVNSGGVLYAYGFITGSGSVTANSDAAIYELFQIADFRGGNQSTGMQNGVFPISQYYVQNIEVPLMLYRGAKEYGVTNLYISGYHFSSVNFIGGSESMFNIESGCVVKRYDGTKDRLVIEVFGDVKLSSVELVLGTWGTSINSADYVLPLNGNITITIKSGFSATVNQDLALIPGSELIIEQNATVTLAAGKRIYIYDSSSWGSNYCHGPRAFAAAMYAPGRTYPRTVDDLKDAYVQVDGTIDASAGYVYTTNSITEGDTDGGANIHSTGTGKVILTAGTETETYQCINNSTSQPIPISPAKLKNANGTYVQSQTDTYTYNLSTGRWECGTHSWTNEDCPCTVCGSHQSTCDCDLFSFYATNLNLGNNLDMLFAMDTSKFGQLVTGEVSNYYAVFTRMNHEAVIVPSADWETMKINSVEYYVVTYSGFAAKEMCDTVYVHIYNSSDERISECKNDGIRDYAMRLWDKVNNSESSDSWNNLRLVIANMLNYGAECQKYFGYKTDDLANKELSATATSITFTDAYADSRSKASNYWSGTNLVTTSNIQLAVAFKNVTGNMYVKFTYTGHKGNVVESNALYPQNTTDGYVIVPEIVVADARCPITITVYNADGSTVISWTESIESYIARNAANDDVFKAFMIFADSAYTYLHNRKA